MKNLTFLFTLLCYTSIWCQSTHTIDNSPNSGAQFTSIQAAVDAAAEGDTLYIHPSQTSYGNFTLNKTLHLRGLAHSAELGPNVFAEIGNISLNANFGAPGFTLEGLRLFQIQVSGSENYSDAVIKNCRIDLILLNSFNAQCDGWVISGNVIWGSSGGIIEKNGHDSWVLVNNYIRQDDPSFLAPTFEGFNSSDLIRNNIIVTDQNGDDLDYCYNCEGTLVENSLVLFNGTGLAIDHSGAEISFNHCLSYSYLGGTLADLNGTDNLDNTDPMFVDASNPNFGYSKDFHIQPGSPAYTHGTDGQELGIYGNSYPFNMRGYPDDLPYPTSMEIDNSVIPPGGTLNVSFEAESN